jgi:hypothetical protein
MPSLAGTPQKPKEAGFESAPVDLEFVARIVIVASLWGIKL